GIGGARGIPAGHPQPGELRGHLPGAARRAARGGARPRLADHHAGDVALVKARALAAAACFAAAHAYAAEFRSVGASAAILYDAPSAKADRLFVASRLYPFEVLVKLDQWTKVRDANGEVAWIENRALGERQTVIVTVPLADVRAGPNAASTLVF